MVGLFRVTTFPAVQGSVLRCRHPNFRKAPYMNPIKYIHSKGFKSEHAYIGGFASIAIALLAWLLSQGKDSNDKAQSDRWGIFIGHWAPTFFAIGLALKNEE